MTRFNVVLLSVALFLGVATGMFFAFRDAGQPSPDVAREESQEAAVSEEPVSGPEGPPTPKTPAWVARVGPTDKGTEKGPTLRAPDQPGWTTRVGPTAYDMTLAQLVVVARSSVRLGKVEGEGEDEDEVEGDILRVEPFILAALPLEEDGEDDMVLVERVVRLLREQKVVSFAKPVLLSVPTDPDSPETWEDERKAWVGVPVPPGTQLAKPLQAVPFDGADVVAAEREVPLTGSEEDWGALIAAAREAGREPTFPLLYRFSGWIPDLQDIHTRLVLPLKGSTTPVP